jgi:hypothetical protein
MTRDKKLALLDLLSEKEKRNEALFLKRFDEGYYRHRPYEFVMDVFPWGKGRLKDKNGPRKWQKDFLVEIGVKLEKGLITFDQICREATASGHGIGKSALVAWVILWGITTLEGSKGVTTANTESQLKTKTWAELSKWYYLSKLQSRFQFTATAFFHRDPKFQKNWRMDMIPWSERNTEAFAGLHNEGKRIIVIFDEASSIPDAIWDVTEGALTDEKTEIIWAVFGNPTRNTGKFRECFRKFRHRWNNRQIDSRTVEGTNKTQLDEWVSDYGLDSDFVKIRVRGLFPSASFKQFISTDLVDEAFQKELDKKQYDFAPIILSLDPAWEGDDEWAIGLRQGLYFKILETGQKNDDDIFLANKLAGLEDEYKADKVFIDFGYGTGIFSAGKSLGRDWMLVNFASKSPNIGCLNMRAHIWNEMKNWLKEGGSIGNDQTLYDELLSPEQVSRLDGKIQIESKKQIKARGLPSPNRADVLAISFAYPVRKKVKKENKRMGNNSSWMG